MINGPGTNGSALVGLLTKHRGDVIASVTNAAHSVIRRDIQLNDVALHLDSATNVHRDSSAIRTVNVHHTLSGVRSTRLIVTIFSGDHPLSRGSLGLVRGYHNGGTITTIGGVSLGSNELTPIRRTFTGAICVDTGNSRCLSRISHTIRRILKISSFSSTTPVLTGEQRGRYYGGTLRDIGRTLNTLRTKVACSTVGIVASYTISRLLRLANGGTAARIMGGVFDGFYIKGWVVRCFSRDCSITIVNTKRTNVRTKLTTTELKYGAAIFAVGLS